MVWDRRRFLQGAGAVAGLGGLPAWSAAGLRVRETAYVVSGQDWVDVFTGRGGEWAAVGRFGSVAASAVCAGRGRLYVGSGVEQFEGRPGGAVEEFAVDAQGQARSAGRRGLALFAGRPEQMAVSPGGRWLVVGLAGGGYNLLALGKDGALGQVTAALRRVGAAARIEGLQFVEESTVVSFSGGRATVLAVSGDGALAFLPDQVRADARRGFEEGLVRAMARAGVGERASVAYG